MAAEREPQNSDRVYPNFEAALAEWLSRWPTTSEFLSSKIAIVKKSEDSGERRSIATADLILFLRRWYPQVKWQGEADAAREAYKNARKMLNIRGEQRPQGHDRFYTVAEAEQLLRYIYTSSRRIRSLEQK